MRRSLNYTKSRSRKNKSRKSRSRKSRSSPCRSPNKFVKYAKRYSKCCKQNKSRGMKSCSGNNFKGASKFYNTNTSLRDCRSIIRGDIHSKSRSRKSRSSPCRSPNKFVKYAKRYSKCCKQNKSRGMKSCSGNNFKGASKFYNTNTSLRDCRSIIRGDIPSYISNSQSVPYKQLSIPSVPYKQLSIPSVPDKQLSIPSVPYKQLSIPSVPYKQLSIPSVPDKQLSIPSVPYKQLSIPSDSQKSKYKIPCSRLNKFICDDKSYNCKWSNENNVCQDA